MADSSTNRRRFLQAGVIGAVGSAVQPSRAGSVNDKIVMAAIGCGGQGSGLAESFAGKNGTQIKFVCDPDSRRADETAKEVEKRGGFRPEVVSDLRRVLDDPSVDAVTVATPDHWHAPAAILALKAGKHVYVEKPCAHNIREGRLLVEAARKHNRVVQHGTQSRSNELIAGAVQMLREGVIGHVLAAKAWNVQTRNNIGHLSPSDPPKEIDYDLWVGPAPFVPYQENRLHYNWHWWYDFGTGDAGNDGVHEIDYAIWGLGVDTHPSKVTATGGKYYFDDDQQFPDTVTASMEYPGDGSPGQRRMLIFEMRLWSSNYPYNIDNGVEFYGTEGRMLVTKRGKLEVYGERNRRIDNPQPRNAPAGIMDHHEDFLDAVRTGRRPHADIEIGHRSATACHLANMAVRLGRGFEFDPQSEQVPHDQEANRLVSRNYRPGHWAVPEGV